MRKVTGSYGGLAQEEIRGALPQALTSSPPPTALRTHLVRALEADLIGPFTFDPASTEVLSLSPTRWYLTGFLTPQHAVPGSGRAR